MNKIIKFMNKVNGLILNILLIVILFLLGIVLYWQLYSYEVLEAREGNYSLDKTVYKQGEDFNIRLNICKNMDIEGDVYGKFVDGVVYLIPEKESRLEVGCYNTYILRVSIPENLPAGNYVYKETITYRVNPIRTITYTFTTPEFEVVEK